MTVLIIGAGPAGLVAANVLAKSNVPFRIIEKRDEPSPLSKALGLHIRSQEMLHQLGCLENIIQESMDMKRADIFKDTKPIGCISFFTKNAPYPYPRIASQVIVEKALRDKLIAQGHHIDFNHILTDVKDGHIPTLHIENNAKKIEILTPDFILACGGAHSIIRQKLNIPFEGDTYPYLLDLIDASFERTPTNNVMGIHLNKNNTVFTTPIQENIWRIVYAAPHHKNPLSQDDWFEIQRKNFPHLPPIKEFIWQANFKTHCRLAQKVQHKNIFLLGDAAHIHSPFGGQGMNTSMQDAYNISWKIAAVYHKKSTPCLLKSYALERQPVMKSVLKSTNFITKVLITENPLKYFLRRIILFIVANQHFIQEKIARRLSGLDISYKKSPIVLEKAEGTLGPHPGDLAPDTPTSKGPLLSQLNVHDHFIVLTKSAPTSFTKGCPYPILEGVDKSIYPAAFYIIRPDGYIGMRANNIDLSHVRDYKAKCLNES